MKILYLTTRLPYPLIGGDKVRSYNMLLQLKKLGHEITLVCLYNENDNIEEALEHKEIFDRIYPIKFNSKMAYLTTPLAVFNDKPFIVQYYYNLNMQKQVDKLLKEEHFDIITGYMPRIAPYLEKHTKENVIIDLCDAFSMMYRRRIQVTKSLFDKFKIGIEYIKMRNYEKKCLKMFNAQTVISKYDKQYLETLSDKSNIHIVKNGVDTDYFSPKQAELKNNICFVGSLRYIANLEAAIYFAQEVFPLIKKEIPDAKFKIIGAYPKPVLYEIAQKIDGVEVTGRVDDVRDSMKDCKISVCPVRIAGGVQNKILEAMSMGIPVVTTLEGSEGIGADESILPIAQNNEDYARKVIELMTSEEKHSAISASSRDFILKNFSWDEIRKELDKIIKTETQK